VDRHVQVRDVGELDRVVLARPDRLGQVLADLVGVDVERRRELDVADVVAAQLHVHQTGDALGRVGVPVVLDALHEGRRAVADADDCHAHLLALIARCAVRMSLSHRKPSSFMKTTPRGGEVVHAGNISRGRSAVTPSPAGS
jgi:hypothetical protein